MTQLRSVEIGYRNRVGQATGLRDSSMLTQDENIIDMRFTVQYRLKDSRDYLFENVNTDEAVMLASESAVREIVGRNEANGLVLYEKRDADRRPSLQTSIQQPAGPAEHRDPDLRRQPEQRAAAGAGAGRLRGCLPAPTPIASA